jgi:hypothetical protein
MGERSERFGGIPAVALCAKADKHVTGLPAEASEQSERLGEGWREE